MNNLKDIYNNVLDNIHKFYGHAFYNQVNGTGKVYTPINNVFFETANYVNMDWEELKNGIIQNYILSENASNFGLYLGAIINKGITIQDSDGNPQNNIPVYVLFTFKNTDIDTYTIVNYENINLKKVNFIINIITHVFQQTVSSVNVNIDGIIKYIRAPQYFYRSFTYKEFSIDIFNHIYQPRFQLIDDPVKIKEITNKYLMDLSSMGSIFVNDPVNKRLLGLPKINENLIRKDYPDVYRIFQEQGVNYRKVITSGSHNPFSK